MHKNDPLTNLKQPSTAMMNAVQRILYPLVNLLLKTGISFPQLAELLKAVYIKVADENFRLENKQQTQSRLSFLTGIHRKDVKRLHTQKVINKEPGNINVGVKLVSRWISESRYLNDKGEPLSLPIKADNSPSFEELVKTVFKQDIRPRVILDEWLNLNIVSLVDNKVQLNNEAFIPHEGLDEKAFFVGLNIADHLSAASHNLLNDSPRFFERCVYYDDLSDESIKELQKMMEEEGMKTLKKLNGRASQLKTSDLTKNDRKHRINIGLYLYHEEKEGSE